MISLIVLCMTLVYENTIVLNRKATLSHEGFWTISYRSGGAPGPAEPEAAFGTLSGAKESPLFYGIMWEVCKDHIVGALQLRGI